MILVSLRVSTETGRRTGTRRRGRRIGRNRERMVAVIRIDEMTRKVGAGDPFIKLRAETSPPHAVRAATARRLAVDEGLDLVVMTGNVRIQRRSSRCSLIGDSIRNGRGSGILDDDSGNSDSGRVDVDRNGSSGWIRGCDGVFTSRKSPIGGSRWHIYGGAHRWEPLPHRWLPPVGAVAPSVVATSGSRWHIYGGAHRWEPSPHRWLPPVGTVAPLLSPTTPPTPSPFPFPVSPAFVCM